MAITNEMANGYLNGHTNGMVKPVTKEQPQTHTESPLQPVQPARPPVTSRTLSPDNKQDMSRFINIIAEAFNELPLTNSFIWEQYNTAPPYPDQHSLERRRKHFESGIMEAATHGAEVVEAGDFSAVALWEGPDYKGKPFTETDNSDDRPIRIAWRNIIRAAKELHLGLETPPDAPATNGYTNGHAHVLTDSSPEVAAHSEGKAELRKFYHLSFLARDPSQPSVPGAISAVMRPFLERARQEGVPVWLEAGTMQGVRVYEHYGFRVVEEVTNGEGSRDERGWPQQGGPGVKAWCMVWDGN